MLDAVAPTETIAYAYGNSSWTDLLTSYNGQNITYDAIGNPTSYLGYTLKWNGRQLSSLSGNGVTASYKYDADGLRSYKKVGNTETTYQYVGDKLMYEKRGTTEFFYYYNSFGNLAGIKYYVNGTRYMVYALCNTRGDVEDLYWGSGNLACHYTYDSWGNVISVTDINGNEITNQNNIGLMNPIRYRGYYYDSEIGMYYLQSRYYNPQVGRFLNADTITDGGAGVLGNNLFIYVANNPVNNYDLSGHWIIKNAIKWVAKNVVKPVVKKVQKSISTVNATCSRGINVSGSPSAFSFNLQVGISIDTKGNVAIQGSYSGGVTGGSPCVSISAYRTVTNAPNVHKLEGQGYQIGGSLGVPVYGVPLYAGGDFNIIPDTELDKLYFGTTTNFGLGTPGGEFHVEFGETATLSDTQFNVFDVAKDIYVKIMEW